MVATGEPAQRPTHPGRAKERREAVKQQQGPALVANKGGARVCTCDLVARHVHHRGQLVVRRIKNVPLAAPAKKIVEGVGLIPGCASALAVPETAGDAKRWYR